jgi:hypothetical protein
MKGILTIFCLIFFGASVVLMSGCSAEEAGEDTDELIEEVDFDEQ